MTIGQRILEEIIKQGMVRATKVGDNYLFIWNGNASEQLDALVEEHYELPHSQ